MSKPATLRRGLTLSEVLVAIAILGVIAAISLPVYNRVKAASQRSACLSNSRQLGLAMSLYSESYDGKLALGHRSFDNWFDKIAPYSAEPVGRCPSYIEGGYTLPPLPFGEQHSLIPRGYSMNYCLYFMGGMDLVNQPNTVLFAEMSEVLSDKEPFGVAWRYPLMLQVPDVYNDHGRVITVAGGFGAVRHNGGANYVLVDLSAKWYKPESFRLPADPNWCNIKYQVTEWRGPVDGPRFATNTGGIRRPVRGP